MRRNTTPSGRTWRIVPSALLVPAGTSLMLPLQAPQVSGDDCNCSQNSRFDLEVCAVFSFFFALALCGLCHFIHCRLETEAPGHILFMCFQNFISINVIARSLAMNVDNQKRISSQLRHSLHHVSTNLAC